MSNWTPNRNLIRAAFVTSAVLVSTVAAHPAGQQREPAFEVASIKENKTGASGTSMNVLPGSRLVATNIALETLIAGAYGTDVPLPPSRVVMPAAGPAAGPLASTSTPNPVVP